jgi:hypothetical protein
MKEFLIAFSLVVVVATIVKQCSPTTVSIETVTKRDTVYLTPDTVIKEVIVEKLKIASVVREVPVPVEVKDTNVYNYVGFKIFDNAVVFDTISVADNKIVNHKQSLALLEQNLITEKIIEIPVVITDTITITKYVQSAKYSLHAGATMVNTALIPTVKGTYKKHGVGIGYNGSSTLLQYTYKLY